jgi:hypothetical protein
MSGRSVPKRAIASSGQDFALSALFDDADEQLLDQIHHVLALDETHLQIELGEFRLPVAPLILVAKAARNLEVLLVSGDHQQLLQLLGRLRESIELAGMDPAGHQVVSRPLGSGLEQNRGLHLDEAALVQEVADVLDHTMAQDDVALQAVPAQVQVAVPQAQGLVDRRIVEDVERGGLGGIQDPDLAGDDFDLPRIQLGVDPPFRPEPHLPSGLDHVLASDFRRAFVRLRGHVRVGDHLNDATPIAQIDEDQTTVIPPPVHPTGDEDLLTDVFLAKLPVVTCLEHDGLLPEAACGPDRGQAAPSGAACRHSAKCASRGRPPPTEVGVVIGVRSEPRQV